jgi:CTP:molybdopterin cytidylyltransferase MocA
MAEHAPLVAVLAAGAGTRFDPQAYGAKLDAMLIGKPVGQWALDAVAAAGLAPGLIVVGADAPQFARASSWSLLVNDRAHEGLGTSLTIAAGAALAEGRALLVLLADMPLVGPEHLAALTAHPFAATLYPTGKPGVPALIGPALLSQVAMLAGDSGAGALLGACADLAVIAPPASMLIDIDRRDDLVRAASLLGAAQRT